MMFELPQVRYVDKRLYRELVLTEARVVDYCSKIKRSIKEENTSRIESEWRILDFYTTEVEKNRKNHLSPSKCRQKQLCLPPVQETMESRDYARAYFLRITGKVYYLQTIDHISIIYIDHLSIIN